MRMKESDDLNIFKQLLSVSPQEDSDKAAIFKKSAFK